MLYRHDKGYLYTHHTVEDHDPKTDKTPDAVMTIKSFNFLGYGGYFPKARSKVTYWDEYRIRNFKTIPLNNEGK